jgi:hypothetical protein
MNHKPKPIKLQEFVQLRDERSLVTLEEMIPCKFYDPTSLRSSDLVKDWKSSHGRKWKMKLTAKERNDERVLWFFLSPLNDQKSPLKSWSCYMRAIGSNSVNLLRFKSSHWINPSLSSQDIFYASRSHLASQLSRSLADELYFANGLTCEK